jgi:hypothetical protein
VAKPNYHHARRQKEIARKTKQQEKQQRKAARATSPAVGEDGNTTGEAVVPGDPTAVSGG